MKLYFIRHGQTDWNVKGKIQGSYDSELNETGIAQAIELSQKIMESHINISKIYSSKQKRALQTAVILGNEISVECIPFEGVEEINFGEWEGLSWNEVQETYPMTYKEWYQDRRYTKTPKGESYQELLERVLSAVHKIIATNHDNVAIVTHSAVIMSLRCYITNTPFHELLQFKMDNADMIEIDSSMIV